METLIASVLAKQDANLIGHKYHSYKYPCSAKL